jgi:copper chaperone CopZ
MKRNKLKKIIFSFLLALSSTCALAQVKSVELGVNGLTCSQCSRSVEMELRKIPFVRDVKMDLQHTNAKVILKQGKTMDLAQFPKAVKDAGFSMRYLKFAIDLSAVNPGPDCFEWQHSAFYFLSPLKENHEKTRTFQVIGKGFLPKKEWAQYTLEKTGACKGRKVYFLKEMNPE